MIGCTKCCYWTLVKTLMLERLRAGMDMSVSRLREMVKDREAWRAAVHGVPRVGY